MRDNEREYWLAGGEDKVKALSFIKERGEALVAMTHLAKKYDGEQFVTRGPCISGLCFCDDTPPDGWREEGKMTIGGKYRPFFFPTKKTKALKAVASDLRSVRAGGASEFSSFMGGPTVMRSCAGLGMRILYMAWEYCGDDLLLTVPLGEDQASSDFAANGSRKLAMSEYWAMREAADKKATAA